MASCRQAIDNTPCVIAAAMPDQLIRGEQRIAYAEVCGVRQGDDTVQLRKRMDLRIVRMDDHGERVLSMFCLENAGP